MKYLHHTINLPLMLEADENSASTGGLTGHLPTTMTCTVIVAVLLVLEKESCTGH